MTMKQLIAVRTVVEDATTRTIEGLAFPFLGRDTYGTFFSARTDFSWGLFPDVAPGATRADDEARFIRPTTFHHGFDPDFGLDRVGGWSPVRVDADGVWVRSQIDKRHAYYERRLKPLLDSGALGLSGGSAEHSVRIDGASGEILAWPAYELALTPVESNPLAQLAARAGDVLTVIGSRDVPRGTTPGAPAAAPAAARYSAAASDASMGAGVLGTLIYLIGEEADEPDQLALLQAAADALTDWIEAERAEVGATPDEELVAALAGIRSAIHDRAMPGAQAEPAATTPSEPGEEQPLVISVRSNPTDELEAVRSVLALSVQAAALEVVQRRTGA